MYKIPLLSYLLLHDHCDENRVVYNCVSVFQRAAALHQQQVAAQSEYQVCYTVINERCKCM